ncbi:MAG: rRNA ((1518)-N(6)/adenine(1519)-N(6))-dimethyltransferase [Labilithrix sp.]|nr:rRNA ((1518)-N(6)/adenine(1519)-N(6))-dimethyltransferase [Labilithrix sp.]
MSDARTVLKRVGLAPKKSFGQNFLVSPHVVESIARACVPDGELGRARVLELGAGLGVLTGALAQRARSVVAVERDRDLVPILGEELAADIAANRVRIVEGDAQTADPLELLGEADPTSPRVLAGNLPYQITGRLLERAVAHADALDRVVFMVQLEVAERLAADPGTKAYGALTVFVRAAFRVEKLFDVSRGSFHPAPDVTSAVVRLEPIRPRLAEENDTFRALVKGAFGARRKTLRNAWSRVAEPAQVAQAAERAGISLDARGETLSVEAFARMAKLLDADR